MIYYGAKIHKKIYFRVFRNEHRRIVGNRSLAAGIFFF